MLDELTLTLDKLSPAEQRVAHLVLKDPQHFTRMSMAEIARECLVSQPTVVRFCKGLGYEGLTDLRENLASSPPIDWHLTHTTVDTTDTSENVASKVVNESISALIALRSGVSKTSVEQASCALAHTHTEGRSVGFYGCGYSSVVARDADMRFSRLGFNSVACTDGYAQVVHAASRKPDDVVVVISASGRTKELLDAVDAANQHSATVIALTCSSSPLANMAAIHVATNHQKNMAQSFATGSRLPHLVAMDILAAAVSSKLDSAVLRAHQERAQRLLSYRRYA